MGIYTPSHARWLSTKGRKITCNWQKNKLTSNFNCLFSLNWTNCLHNDVGQQLWLNLQTDTLWSLGQNKKLLHLDTLSTTRDGWARSLQGRHCFPRYLLPIASSQPWKVRRPSLFWLNDFSPSLFFSFLIDFFFQPSLTRLEDRNSEWIEVYTPLFSVNYFISLVFLVGHFDWCVS